METTIPEYHKRLFEAQEKAVRMYNEDWTEEQIRERCNELKNIIISKEDINNRFRNERLNKIWKARRNEGKFY